MSHPTAETTADQFSHAEQFDRRIAEDRDADRMDVPQSAMLIFGLSAGLWVAIIAVFKWLF